MSPARTARESGGRADSEPASVIAARQLAQEAQQHRGCKGKFRDVGARL
jgi:hypothetical protein